MDKERKKYFQQQAEQISTELNACNYSDNFMLAHFLDKLATLVAEMINEL